MATAKKLIDILIALLSFLFMLSGTVIGITALVNFNIEKGVIAVLMILISWSLTRLWKVIRG